jgi:hypothetical protein
VGKKKQLREELAAANDELTLAWEMYWTEHQRALDAIEDKSEAQTQRDEARGMAQHIYRMMRGEDRARIDNELVDELMRWRR